MRTILIIVTILVANISSKGNSLVLDQADKNFMFNLQTLSAKGKTCLLINYLSKSFVIEKNTDNLFIRPLIVLRIFDWKLLKNISRVPVSALKVAEYCHQTVIPALIEDMKVNVLNLNQFESISSTNTFDTLFVLTENGFDIYTGFVISDFFNAIDFHQSTILQTGRTILNTDASIAPISNWSKDSIPVPDVDDMIGDKIFLLKKNQQDYIFFRHPSSCSDCSLNFYNEYVYRKDYGFVAFKSKYVSKTSSNSKMLSSIDESKEYYYFK